MILRSCDFLVKMPKCINKLIYEVFVGILLLLLLLLLLFINIIFMILAGLFLSLSSLSLRYGGC